MVISLFVCGNWIWKAYVKWDTNPIVISFAEKLTSVSEIPFPAVTVCPIAKADPYLFNVTKTYSKIFKQHYKIYQGPLNITEFE